jgi:flap endonuclease-1
VNEEGLLEFMCKDHGFNEERIKKSVAKLANLKNSSTQLRLDSFFKVIPKSKEEVAKANAKRKATAKANVKPLKAKKRVPK